MFYLDEDEFHDGFNNRQYSTEIYEYSVTIEKLKVVHALSLGSVAFFVLMSTRRFKILNEKHYAQLLLASVLVTALYFIPVLYLGYSAFRLAGQVYYEGSDFALSKEVGIE